MTRRTVLVGRIGPRDIPWAQGGAETVEVTVASSGVGGRVVRTRRVLSVVLRRRAVVNLRGANLDDTFRELALARGTRFEVEQ